MKRILVLKRLVLIPPFHRLTIKMESQIGLEWWRRTHNAHMVKVLQAQKIILLKKGAQSQT